MFVFLAVLACVLGALLQFAVHRAPDIKDTRRTVTVARRITMVSLVVAAAYLTFGNPTPVVGLVLGLFGMGQMLYAAHNLRIDKINWELHLGPDT